MPPAAAVFPIPRLFIFVIPISCIAYKFTLHISMPRIIKTMYLFLPLRIMQAAPFGGSACL